MPTLSDLKAYLGITTTDYDVILQLFLDSAESFVETYIGRSLQASDYTEYINGNGQPNIVLKNYPVNSITTFRRNIGTLSTPERESVDTNSYKLDGKVGTILLTTNQYRGLQNYEVVYNAGYASIPGDLKLAILKISSSYYNARNSDGIKSETVAGDKIEYGQQQVPSDVMVILDQYRDL